jgi:hypothetical protein
MKKIALFAAVVTIALSACQKEASNTSPLPAASLRVKTYTEDVRSAALGNVVVTFNLSYDGNDKLISMIDAANAGNKFVFAYTSSSKYTMDLFVNNIFELHVDYFLNSQLQPDSSFQYNNTNDSSTEKYVYNPAHQLTTLREYDYSAVTGSSLWNTTAYTHDGAGNLIRSEDGDGNVYTYEYYTDKVYLMPQAMPVLTATQKVNLLKKLTLTIGGTVEGTVDNTYTFDSKDRVSTIRDEYSNGDLIIKTYTYFD